ncbi:Tn3 family transposase [Streptomyces sp. NPDC004721]
MSQRLLDEVPFRHLADDGDQAVVVERLGRDAVTPVCSDWAPTWASSVVAVTGKHGESEATLRRVRHMFANRANMRAALVKLVNATFAARDEMWWGSGTACVSASGRFDFWSSNLMAE